MINVSEEILTICSHCKRISIGDPERPGSAIWIETNDDFEMVADLLLSHGICPVCYKKEMKRLGLTE